VVLLCSFSSKPILLDWFCSSCAEDLVSWFYDDSGDTPRPVTLIFSANVTFEDSDDIPLSTAMSATMEQANYEEYIMNYAWNAGDDSLFFETQQVLFKRGF